MIKHSFINCLTKYLLRFEIVNRKVLNNNF